MALDLSKIRNRLNKLQGNSSLDNVLWRPEEGNNNRIRIVPLQESPDFPFKELYFHYLNNPRRTYLSPVSIGKPDPFLEASDELLNSGERLPKDEWIAAKNLAPQKRTYLLVIDRNNEKAGPRFWGFSRTVFESLLTLMSDEDYGDITSITEGHDLKLSFTPADKSPTGFAKTTVNVVPKTSPLTTDEDQLSAWLEDQPDLLEAYEMPTYEVLQNALATALGGDVTSAPEVNLTSSDDADEDDWDDDDDSTTAAASATASKNAVKDAEEEFASMFDED